MNTVKQNTELNQLEKFNMSLFRSEFNPHDTYVLISPGGCNESAGRLVLPNECDDLYKYLLKYLLKKGYDPSPGVIRAFMQRIAAKARYSDKTFPIATRIAKHEGDTYIDLADESGLVVRITQGDWELTTESPVKFIRHSGMKPLPTPDVDGNIEELRHGYINVSDDEAWVLLMSWLLMTFNPDGPCPLLFLNGEQGTGKSTSVEMLRSLIDPNVAPLRAAPSSERQLYQDAIGSWVLCYDNLSKVNDRLSDALCRMVTGDGYTSAPQQGSLGGRTTFVRRPILMTSIDDMVLASDLLDRMICLTLPKISGKDRKTEADLIETFDEARPRIFGGILNVLAETHAHLSEFNECEFPRMADFAQFAMAAEKHLGFAQNTFANAYDNNRTMADMMVVESCPVGAATREFLLVRNAWEGTASQLLDVLQTRIVGRAGGGRIETPRKLSGMLRHVAPHLRRLGFDVSFCQRTAASRLVKLERLRDITDAEQKELETLKEADFFRSVARPSENDGCDGDDGNLDVPLVADSEEAYSRLAASS